jgi:hypothetical protein
MTLITGDERRRWWSEEDRGPILAAIEEPGAVAAWNALTAFTKRPAPPENQK